MASIMNQNFNSGLTVTLIAISSIVCGAMLCATVWIMSNICGYNYDHYVYFLAYLSGSIGFFLSAPVHLIFPILRKFPYNTMKITTVWGITTLGVLLLACAVGFIFMLIFKWMYGTVNPTDMAVQFISGAFLLFVSGGIHWFFYRKKR